jgi:hypothetical protein
MNIIPKSGGNTFAGSGFLNTAGKWSSSEKLTDELRALNPNLRENPGVINAYDWSASFGGPIKRGRTTTGAERDSVWDGFDVTVNARFRGGVTAQVGTTTGRAKVNTCEVDVRYNQVNALTGAIMGPNPRGCNDVEPWQTTLRGTPSCT